MRMNQGVLSWFRFPFVMDVTKLDAKSALSDLLYADILV